MRAGDMTALVKLLASLLLLAAGGRAQIDWQASDTTPALFEGNGTYYGQQPGQNDYGTCSFGAAKGNTLGLDWKTGVQTYIAFNRPQFAASNACGLCLMYRGYGPVTPEMGTTPINTNWTMGFVDNECPECLFGALDLDLDGNGRWNVEWFPVPCNVGNGKFVYTFAPGADPYWAMFSISNTRVPIDTVQAKQNGTWTSLARSFDNHFYLNPPFAFPLALRITSVLGNTVEDWLPWWCGGQGTSQFPDRGAIGAFHNWNPANPASGPVIDQIPVSDYNGPVNTVQTAGPEVGVEADYGACQPPAGQPPQPPQIALADGQQCGGTGANCGSYCLDSVYPYTGCANPKSACYRQSEALYMCTSG